MDKPIFPFGQADVLTPAYAATIALTINNNMTIVKLSGLNGAVALNLAADAELREGAIVVVEATQGATGRNVTFGGSAKAAGITGVANDRDTVTLVFDGSEFIGIGAQKIVDAA